MEQISEFKKTESQGWQGDWKAGERPEGYKSLTGRYLSLKQRGYSELEALGDDFVAEHNELMAQAKIGRLNPLELKRFLELNAKRSKAMDTFEEWYKTKPRAN